MASLEAQIEGLTGLTIESSGTNPTQAQLTQFLADGLSEVINRIITLKPEEISKFTTTTTSHSHIAKTGKILSVVREHDDTSILRPCTPISPQDRYEATNTDSLYYRSKYNPGYYELDGNIHIVPVASGTGDNDLIVTQVKYDTGVAYGDSIPDDFPNEYNYLLALYASCRSLLSAMAGKAVNLPAIALPPVPTAPTLSDNSVTFTTTAPTYNELVVAPCLLYTSDAADE